MPSAVSASCSTMAEVVPATVTSPWRGPCETPFATISATFGPGISIRTSTARTKPI